MNQPFNGVLITAVCVAFLAGCQGGSDVKDSHSSMTTAPTSSSSLTNNSSSAQTISSAAASNQSQTSFSSQASSESSSQDARLAYSQGCPSQPTPTETVQMQASTVQLAVGAEPSNGSTQTNTGKIIRAGETFDGQNKRYNLSGGTQAEGQPSLFALEDGATIRNVVIGDLSADGIHCYGSCYIENVWWEDIGEDAATAKGPAGSLMHVHCGGAFGGEDKTFQHNGRGEVKISHFIAEDAGKLYRACGDCTNNGGPRTLTIDNVFVKNVATVAGINTNFGDQVYITDLVIEHSGTHKVKVCQVYNGVVKGQGSTSALGVEFETQNCNVSPSDITLIGDTRINLTDYTGTATPKQQ